MTPSPSNSYFFQLSTKVNQTDDHGLLPLDLALSSKQEELANTLLEHKADVNLTDSSGLTLLHLAVARSNLFHLNCLEIAFLSVIDRMAIQPHSTPLPLPPEFLPRNFAAGFSMFNPLKFNHLEARLDQYRACYSSKFCLSNDK